MNQSILQNPAFQPPPVTPVPEGVHRPLWSVMIPTYNCAQYLRQTLESVLAQDPGPKQMQIEVVDDCSTKDDPEAVVRELGKGRVLFYRKPKNEGAIANFNTCIEHSCGHLVHILHGDDYVAGGFFKRIENAFQNYPQAGIVATRVLNVDEDGNVKSESPRTEYFETFRQGGATLHYPLAIQFAGAVIKRSFYEQHGGYLTGLVHCADAEMWMRVFFHQGGICLPDTLGFYREFAANDTGRLVLSGGNVADVLALADYAERHYGPAVANMFRLRAATTGVLQAESFLRKRNYAAAKANLRAWRQCPDWFIKVRTGLLFLRIRLWGMLSVKQA